jgi:hypothetical protein
MAGEQLREFTIEKWVAQLLLRGILGLAVVAALGYVADFAVWRARVAAGGGMDQVQVDLFTVAELKGGKEDYYPQGTVPVSCSISLYPQGGVQPCWWQRRHLEKIQRY